MSLLLNQPWKLCLRKPVLDRSSPLQTPPCYILGAKPCGEDLGKLMMMNANETSRTYLEKKVPLELTDNKKRVTVGSSHGWIATLKDDGILRLQDDLNPVASDTDLHEIGTAYLADCSVSGGNSVFKAPYCIPPQNID